MPVERDLLYMIFKEDFSKCVTLRITLGLSSSKPQLLLGFNL